MGKKSTAKSRAKNNPPPIPSPALVVRLSLLADFCLARTHGTVSENSREGQKVEMDQLKERAGRFLHSD